MKNMFSIFTFVQLFWLPLLLPRLLYCRPNFEVAEASEGEEHYFLPEFIEDISFIIASLQLSSLYQHDRLNPSADH